MKIYLFILVFLLIGAFFIISENGLALSKPDNVAKFGQIYYSWLVNLFDNSKNITGFIIKMEWLPNK